MRLHNLVKSEGSTHPTKRLGRGRGSGHGKTSGRGHKGQHARAGSHIRPGFESGHIPLYRRLPKRGFNRARFQDEWAIVNLSAFERLPEDVKEVDRNVLAKAGIIRKADILLKVLGQGEITRALTIHADKFSASASSKIEQAGGKAVTTTPVEQEEQTQADSE